MLWGVYFLVLSIWCTMWVFVFVWVFWSNLGMFSCIIFLKIWSMPLTWYYSSNMLIIRRFDVFIMFYSSCLFLFCVNAFVYSLCICFNFLQVCLQVLCNVLLSTWPILLVRLSLEFSNWNVELLFFHFIMSSLQYH